MPVDEGAFVPHQRYGTRFSPQGQQIGGTEQATLHGYLLHGEKVLVDAIVGGQLRVK
jgi:hypothetical protein